MIIFKLHKLGNIQNVIFLADKEKDLVTLLSALFMIKEKDNTFCVDSKNLLLELVLMESNDIVNRKVHCCNN